jgi:hypothetical protein
VGRTLLFILFIAKNSFGAKLNPLPIENQFRNTAAVIHARYKGSSYKKLPNEMVLTEFSFKILDSVGIEQVKIINKNHFLVFSPGGIWQGLVYNSRGRVTFQPGEEVVLLLKESGQGFELQNQGLSKYKKIIENGEIYLSSSEFPSHPKLGKIRIAEFNRLVKNKFGKELTVILEDDSISNKTLIMKPKKLPERKITSLPNKEYAEDSMLLLVVMFGILGAIGIKMNRSL